MGIREHAVIFWQRVRRWPRWTAIVLGVFAVFYFLYYAGVEAMEIPQSLAAALGMVLMLVALKVGWLTAFSPLFSREASSGAVLVQAAFGAVPFVLAVAISLLLVRQDVEGPPLEAAPYLLIGAALGFTLCVGLTARVSQWLGNWRRR